MKPESLHALIIDRHFGELPGDVAELLDLHLAQNPAARAEAEKVLQSLEVTRRAVVAHPQLARATPAETAPLKRTNQWGAMWPQWLARAAAVMVFAGLAAAAGFMAGRSAPRVIAKAGGHHAKAPVPVATARIDGPWARYRMDIDPSGGGLQVVRVDVADLENQAPR